MTNPILARFQNNEAVLIDPQASAMLNAYARQASATLSTIVSAKDTPQMSDDFWYHPSDWRAAYRPYVVKDGILHIPVKGALLNDFGYALGSWATGYDYIRRAFDRGLGDGDVRGIALVIDSPGGMVAGNFDLVDHIFANRGAKPIAAFAHESAYSAAYSLASAADPGSLYVARTGGVGSIGVVTSHVDVSKAVADDGLVITFIHAGAHKVDGNPYEALKPEVKARIQERIDALYAIFVSTVSRNRGLSEEAVRATEAATFMAPEALSNGLADSIRSLDDALADFSASLNPNSGDETMADISQADHEVAVAAARTEGTTQGHAAGVEAGRAEGVTAERSRIAAILDSEAAADRPAAARMLAFDTDKDAESATVALAKLPAEKADGGTSIAAPTGGAPTGMFTAAMDGSPNPDITDTGGDADADANDPVKLAQAYGLAGFAEAAK